MSALAPSSSITPDDGPQSSPLIVRFRNSGVNGRQLV